MKRLNSPKPAFRNEYCKTGIYELGNKMGTCPTFFFLFSSSGRIEKLRSPETVLGLPRVWSKTRSSRSPFSTCIQQCKDLMDYQASGERNERRREPNISIDFCISCPPLAGSSQLKVTAITSLVAEGRKRSSESNDLSTAKS